MGAPSAQVQSPQSSQPASKGAGASPSTPSGSGKGGGIASAMSGQPQIGQPNTNGNTGLAPVNANFVSPTDGATPTNPYPNTIGDMGSPAGGPNGQPLGQPKAKGGGNNSASAGKA